MSKQRSIGVIVFGILFILMGVLSVFNMPLFSILYFTAGICILMLNPFARYLAIVTSVLGIAVNTIVLVKLIDKNMFPQIFVSLTGPYLIHLGAIYFFTRRKVKEHFEQAAPEASADEKMSIGIVLLATFLLVCFVISSYMNLITPHSPVQLLWFAFPILFLLSAIGILMLKKWGWIVSRITSLAVVITMGFVTYDHFNYCKMHPSNYDEPILIPTLIIAAIFYLIFRYLSSSKVKGKFK